MSSSALEQKAGTGTVAATQTQALLQGLGRHLQQPECHAKCLGLDEQFLHRILGQVPLGFPRVQEVFSIILVVPGL